MQVGGLDETRLELDQRAGERVGEAGEAGRRAEPVEGRRRDRGAHDELPLGVGDHRPVRTAVARETLEEIVERPDASREKRAALSEQLGSIRSTSDPYGTMSTGSRSSASR